MSSKAMSLEGRIKNYAKSNNIAAQVVLQNYMFERFLERLSVSEYSEKYSGSVVKTQIQSFYNELIYIVDKGEGYFPTRLHNQSTVLDSRRTMEFGC